MARVFRNSKSQAKQAIKKAIRINFSRHDNKKTKFKVHSIGSARSYEQSLSQVSDWLKSKNINTGLKKITKSLADKYLQERSRIVGQKTLDRDRQSLQIALQQKIKKVHSINKNDKLANKSRAYKIDQVREIAKNQNERDKIATALAYTAGLRAHEILTLRPVNEQKQSTHRQWSEKKFTGREGKIYTVIGKGGLIREVKIPTKLAIQLEERRLENPIIVVDRKINYQQYYDISGGNKWSKSFSKNSNEKLNFSNGAHGLRHSYAQERMNELQERGFIYENALEIVSQELGHFRPEITEVYLR